MRKIIHIDMDAFYAAVEQRDNPALKGKPVVIGGSPNSRGVVATASYEARKFGIHSAMSCAQAYKLCNKAVFLEPNFVKYKKVSSQIRAIFKEYSDLVEPLSLDEAYIDVTENKKNIASATKIANEIRHKIWNQLKLTASAGVAPNKFLAKIASDINKPNGTKVIHPTQAENFINNLPIGKFFGIGKVTKEKMLKLGIKNGADLKKLSLTDITYHFGKMGNFYYDIVRGIDNRDICPNRIRKSIGAEITFPKDISNIASLNSKISEIAMMVENRLKKEKTQGKTITLKIRYANFKRATRSLTSDVFLSTAAEISTLAKDLLRKSEAGKRPIRLLGITISNLNLNTPPKKKSPQLEFTF